MILFEKAAALKKGAFVCVAGCKATVVKTDVDAARLAAAVGDANEHLPGPPKISWAMYPAL